MPVQKESARRAGAHSSAVAYLIDVDPSPGRLSHKEPSVWTHRHDARPRQISLAYTEGIEFGNELQLFVENEDDAPELVGHQVIPRVVRDDAGRNTELAIAAS